MHLNAEVDLGVTYGHPSGGTLGASTPAALQASDDPVQERTCAQDLEKNANVLQDPMLNKMYPAPQTRGEVETDMIRLKPAVITGLLPAIRAPTDNGEFPNYSSQNTENAGREQAETRLPEPCCDVTDTMHSRDQKLTTVGTPTLIGLRSRPINSIPARRC